MKKKYLFYYCEAVNAWVPVPEKTEEMINVDCFDTEDTESIEFKVFEMTEEEFKNLPIE